MTVSLESGAADLGRRHPEWLPWLTVIEQVLREATRSPSGKGLSPSAEVRSKVKLHCWTAPRSISIRPLSPRGRSGYCALPMRAARRSMSALDGSKRARLNTMDLFIASLCQNWQQPARDCRRSWAWMRMRSKRLPLSCRCLSCTRAVAAGSHR